MLTVPRPSNDASTSKTAKGKSADSHGSEQPQPSSKPEIVVATADDTMGDNDNLKTPLFAHEALGAYDFADTSDHESEARDHSRRHSSVKSKDIEVADFDVNDPTIEQFPSDRSSIMDALRTIQTHLSEDQTHLDDIPTSPRVVSARRTSIDSIDETSLSPAILSPTTSRRRDSRLSHSSGRNRSAASLGSIAEEPKPASQRDQKHPRISPPESQNKPIAADVKAPRSEDDEGVAMTTSEVTPKDNSDEISPAQITSIEPLRDAFVESEPIGEPAQEPKHLVGVEEASNVESGHPSVQAEVAPKSADRPAPQDSITNPKQNVTSQEAQTNHAPEQSPVKRSATGVSLFRSLFNILFGSRSNM